MSQMTEHPSFTELSDALQKTESPLHASEVHGIICGIICATSGKIDTKWEKLVVGPKKSKNTLELLQRLYTLTYKEMSEFSFEFVLLLPDDSTDINVRAENLGLLCQGFLTGLQQSQTSIANRITPEVSDALNDLTEIAQVKYEDLSSTEEDETAYFELAEYVRLVILMIYHDLKAGDQEPLLDDDLLH
jgi:uncharacterized protein YgfB (UPF0149 family)